MNAPRPLANVARLLLILFSAMTVCVVRAQRGGGGSSGQPGTVLYSPAGFNVEGPVPLVQQYNVTITAPSDLPASTTVAFTGVVNGFLPAGVAPATALSYVTFSPSQLTFTAGQSQTVSVSINIPVGAPAGAYGYQLTATNSANWGYAPSTLTNNGFSINATVTVVATPTPPTVTITDPFSGLNNQTQTVNYTGLPLQLSFGVTASVTDANYPLTNVVADIAGVRPDGTLIPSVPILLTTLSPALPTASTVGTGVISITTPGVYTVTAMATNLGGTATDTQTFTITVIAPPPTVAFSQPSSPGQTFTFNSGTAPYLIPITFTGTSGAPTGSSTIAITALSAVLDPTLDANGVPLPGTGTVITLPAFTVGPVVTVTTSLPFSSSGTHTVYVTATDEFGQVANTITNFSINVVTPTPVCAIAPIADINVPTQTSTANVPFTITSTTTTGFTVDSVVASLDGQPIAIALNAPALGTADLVTSTGTLANVPVGQHTVTAYCTSGGGIKSAVASTTFNVIAAVQPPTVVINTPADQATFTRYATGPALSIPLTFTGTSNVTNGVITQVTATLDGAPLAVTATLNQKVVNASATMSVTAAGLHTIVVTATDAVGTATAAHTFTVNVLQGSTISGTIFFDVNTNGTFDSVEFGLAGVPVTLRSSTGQVLATTTSSSSGAYSFAQLAPGSYNVTASPASVLTATAGSSRHVTVDGITNVSNVNIGFMLDFCSLQGMSAGGFTIGYWKNNLDKAIAGKTSGIQVSTATLRQYTTAIGAFALSPYDNITMKTASAIMASTSSNPTDLLSKQLIASEYNYQNHAYLNGDGTTTYLFVWWGEYVLSHPSDYSSTYILWAQNWFDAYNNTHGGAISGPALLGTSCTGSTSTSGSGGYGENGGSSGGTSGSGSCDSSGDHNGGSGGGHHTGGSNDGNHSGGSCDNHQGGSGDNHQGGSGDNHQGGGSDGSGGSCDGGHHG